jgi:hypothetical protein
MVKHKETKETDFLGSIIGNELSQNVQVGTEEAIKGMDLFRQIVSEKYNVDFAQKKGNFFEFIEAAKFNCNAANEGKSVRALVTHADGRPRDLSDIELIDKGKIVDKVQAKVNDKASITAYELKDAKYHDMQRITVSDHVDKAKELTSKRANTESIYSSDYKNSKENFTDSLTDRRDGTNSGGTSTDELEKAAASPELYATAFELKQYAREVGITAVNSAASSMVITGSISVVQNMFEYCKGKKELKQALAEIGVTTAKSGLTGLATGGISGVLRILGVKSSISILKDKSVTVTLANGLLDMGVSIYDYAQGKIDAKELASKLKDTTIKSVSTVYFTKAIAATLGATSAFIPFAIYTISSYGIAACSAIIKDAKLKAEEYNRIAALYIEYNKQIAEQRKQMEQYFENYISDKKANFTKLLDVFETNLFQKGDFDRAISSIESFASDFGIALKYVDFDEFDNMMKSKGDLVL